MTAQSALSENRQKPTNATADLFRPVEILPVAAGTARPFWSVMVPTYNRERYLEETLRGILAQVQEPQRMQLCVVDNATTTFDVPALLKRLAGDRMEYFRHPVNIGGIRNINACFAQSRGRWVHVLHDDDLVLPGFYHAFEKLIEQHPDAGLLVGPVLCMNETGFTNWVWAPKADSAGPIENFLISQATGNHAPTQSAVFPRSTLERVGGYAEGLVFTPDWEMAFRAASCGPVCTVALPYAVQRAHVGSDTSKLMRGQRHLEESRLLIDELCRRLPPGQQAKLPKRRYQILGDQATTFASSFTTAAEFKHRMQHLLYAMRWDPSLGRLRQIVWALKDRLLKH